MKRKKFRLLNISPVSSGAISFPSSENSKVSRVSCISLEEDRKRVSGHDILDCEKKSNLPYLKNGSELIIPLDTLDKYRWWAGGQSVFDTLLELEAPDSLIERHIGKLSSSTSWKRWLKIREARAASLQESSGCRNLPYDFDKK